MALWGRRRTFAEESSTRLPEASSKEKPSTQVEKLPDAEQMAV
jgi:hypothetical protein